MTNLVDDDAEPTHPCTSVARVRDVRDAGPGGSCLGLNAQSLVTVARAHEGIQWLTCYSSKAITHLSLMTLSLMVIPVTVTSESIEPCEQRG